MAVQNPPPEALQGAPGGTGVSPYEQEEVFAQDGVVEDIIAVDHKCT